MIESQNLQTIISLVRKIINKIDINNTNDKEVIADKTNAVQLLYLNEIETIITKQYKNGNFDFSAINSELESFYLKKIKEDKQHFFYNLTKILSQKVYIDHLTTKLVKMMT